MNGGEPDGDNFAGIIPLLVGLYGTRAWGVTSEYHPLGSTEDDADGSSDWSDDGGGDGGGQHVDGVQLGLGAVLEVLGNAGNQIHMVQGLVGL